MKNMTKRIFGEQIYLRPITDSEEDTANIIRWRNSDAVRPYFIYQKPFTIEGHKQWLEKEIFSGKGYQFIVCKSDSDRPIGCTYLRDYDTVSRKAEYGFFLGEVEERGKGIGKELLAVCIAYCKEHGVSDLTVNAAPTGLPFYLANGFEALAGERFEGGLRFTPMTLRA